MRQPRRHALNAGDSVRIKRLALGLLLSAGALYGLASFLEPRHAAWGYVAAFAEAAMVGAIADWFAVVALFRHPLGLPIPHTAIIPSNKDRIGENLANFICANFLSTPQVLQKLERFGVAARLAGWLADPRHAAQAAAQGVAALRYSMGALDDARVQHFFSTALTGRLERLDLSRLAGRLLAALTADDRHRVLVDAVLRKLATVLDDDALKARMAEVIATEVKYLKLVALDNVAGRYAAAKLASGLIKLVGEIADTPDHPLRLELDVFVASFIVRLDDDAELRARIQALQRELLASPALSGYLQGLWSDWVAGVSDDLQRPDSIWGDRLAAGIRHVGDKLLADAPMRAWVDDQLLAAAPRWIERYREDIRNYIVARVGDWNTAEMTRELERNIGRDLQFIRINGTLVGGLVGLGIHATTQWLRSM